MDNTLELKELTEQLTELFGVDQPEQIGDCLMAACTDQDKLDAFCEIVDGDLSKDWLQSVYQYYLADREGKKQDYTPHSIASLMGVLTGKSERIVDLCAGSGALIIQKWNQNHDIRFTAIELDENVIPFLLFNMVVRNIRCRVHRMNALVDEEPVETWEIVKGEKYGRFVDFKPTL